jgi:uncharacterized membrane protein YebE (DUF533 family)
MDMNFEKVMTSLAGSGVLGGLAGGAVSGALMSNKKARKTAGTLLKVGGLAALGGMAWKAYQGYQAQAAGGAGQAAGVPPGRAADAGNPAPVAPPPADPVWSTLDNQGFAIDPADNGQGSRALLLIQAMIAAACADGHLDGDERERIMQQVSVSDLAPDEKALVFDAMHNPPSLLQLSQRVDCPELAAEVYMASLLAVDASRAEARLYLDALAFRLGIPGEMVKQLHNQLPLPVASGSDLQGDRVA